MTKTRKERITKRLLIVDGWEIDVDDNYVNSLDSKINDFKNSIGLLNDDCGGIINALDRSCVDKYNTCDRHLTLRLKLLGKRQVEKLASPKLYHFFILHYQLGNNGRIKSCKVFR